MWVPKSQDFAKVQGSGFQGNQEKAVSQEITLFEIGFFSYSVLFMSKGMCVYVQGRWFPIFPFDPMIVF